MAAREHGSGANRVEPHAIDLPFAVADSITLMELVEAVLRHEAGAFLRRRDAAAMIRFLTENHAGRVLARQVVCFGDLESKEITIDTEAAVENARLAFDGGFFTVTSEGRDLESLEEPIAVVDGLDVVFVPTGSDRSPDAARRCAVEVRHARVPPRRLHHRGLRVDGAA